MPTNTTPFGMALDRSGPYWSITHINLYRFYGTMVIVMIYKPAYEILTNAVKYGLAHQSAGMKYA
ncbi:MAG: hypothetical protein ISR58_10830 [Anaerolineales bacterium]|nr:hypothetical protein [Anaerolineales bacterium]